METTTPEQFEAHLRDVGRQVRQAYSRLRAAEAAGPHDGRPARRTVLGILRRRPAYPSTALLSGK
jgi:hypothetical protein